MKNREEQIESGQLFLGGIGFLVLIAAINSLEWARTLQSIWVADALGGYVAAFLVGVSGWIIWNRITRRIALCSADGLWDFCLQIFVCGILVLAGGICVLAFILGEGSIVFNLTVMIGGLVYNYGFSTILNLSIRSY